jgi:nucleoside-diphosphate-sugar epimerase
MAQNEVLIAGCGEVGSALARRLVADGADVFGLRRRPAGLPAGVRPLAIDLREGAMGGVLPRGVGTLVFSAAADAGDEASYRAVYVEGLRNVIEGLAEVGPGPSRIVFTSSTSVYGQSNGEWVDEKSATDPRGFSGRVMLEAESFVADWARRHSVSGTSLRLGGIYGPGRTRLVDLVRGGRATCSEDAPTWTNRIHVEDAAAAIHHLLRLEDGSGTWIGVDDEPAEQCRVYDWLAARLGVERPRRVPSGAAGPAKDTPNRRCSNRRLRDSGFRFRYPTFREGYAEMIGAGD